MQVSTILREFIGITTISQVTIFYKKDSVTDEEKRSSQHKFIRLTS